jgi:hypothetical protein
MLLKGTKEKRSGKLVAQIPLAILPKNFANVNTALGLFIFFIAMAKEPGQVQKNVNMLKEAFVTC